MDIFRAFHIIMIYSRHRKLATFDFFIFTQTQIYPWCSYQQKMRQVISFSFSLSRKMKKKENASFDSEILQLDSVDTADTTQLPIEHLIGFVKKRRQLGVTAQGRRQKNQQK